MSLTAQSKTALLGRVTAGSRGRRATARGSGVGEAASEQLSLRSCKILVGPSRLQVQEWRLASHEMVIVTAGPAMAISNCEWGELFPTQTKLQHSPGAITLSRGRKAVTDTAVGGIIPYLKDHSLQLHPLTTRGNATPANQTAIAIPSHTCQSSVKTCISPSNSSSTSQHHAAEHCLCCWLYDTQCTPRADQSS